MDSFRTTCLSFVGTMTSLALSGDSSQRGKEDDKSISLALFRPLMPESGALEGADLPSNISGTPGGSYACLLQLLPDAQNSFK